MILKLPNPKAVIVLLLIFCVQIPSHRLWGSVVSMETMQQQEKRTLKEAISLLEKKMNYKFAYLPQEINLELKVEYDASQENIKQILDRMFSSTNISYEIKGTQIILTVKKPFKLVVRVTDRETKLPIPGATLIVKGTNNGAITDGKGNAILNNTFDGSEIEVSYVGVKSKTIKANALSQEITVLMEKEMLNMETVVVTGYQTLSKERSAGSFKTVKGDDIKDKATFGGSVLSGLDGLSTGLSMSVVDGKKVMTMRGINSINSDQSVLYVLDGVATSADNIENLVNSNDIESVTILKDATAASIWGSRAANGVVVITTKRGTSHGKRIKISYDGTFTYKGLPDSDYNDYMSSAMFLKNAKEIFNPEAYSLSAVTTTPVGTSRPVPVVYPHEQILYDFANSNLTESQLDAKLAELASLNNRDQIENYFMEASMQTSHSLSFNGGSEFHRYYGSFRYDYNRVGNRDQSRKYAINLKQDFDLTKWLKFDITLNSSFTDTKNATQPSMNTGSSTLPYMMFKDEGGNNLSHANLLFYDKERERMERESGLSLDYIPLDDLNNASFDETRQFNLRINTGFNIKLFKGFNFDSRFQYQRSSAKIEKYIDGESFSVRQMRANYTERPTEVGKTGKTHFPSTGGNFTNGLQHNNEWTIRNQFMYDNRINESHQIASIIGAEVRGSVSGGYTNLSYGYNPQTLSYVAIDEKTLSSSGVSNPILPISSTSAINKLPSGRALVPNELDNRYVSFYANAAYTYQSKYTLNASIRVDQSNLFGTSSEVQFKPLWSVGGAWNMNSEKFMEAIKFLDRLTLRSSYGLGGNSPDPNLGSPYNLIRSSSLSTFPGLGYIIDSPANNKLIWEKTATFNLGLDFSVLDSRLSGSFEYYDRKTSDLLAISSIDPTTGWAQALVNTGSLYNRGVEVSLNSININSGGFAWRTTLNVTKNSNKVTAVSDILTLTAPSLPSKSFVEGYPAYALFAFQWAGLDEMGDAQIWNEDQKIKRVSNLKDINSVRFMGSTEPKLFGSFTNSFSYGGFNLSFMFIYNWGHKLRQDVNTFSSGRLSSNIHKDFDNRWRKEGDENFTNIPSYIPLSATETNRRTNTFYMNSDINVLDASYIKLRDLTFAYSLPKSVCNKLASDAIKIKFQAGNLFTITKNKEGIDPEYFKSGIRGTKYGPSYSVGLTVNFK